MEFKIRSFKGTEFDVELNNILRENEIGTDMHVVTYEYDEANLTVTINDNVIKRMKQEQLSLLLEIR